MKKALVVGIDAYPSCPLLGCKNDANEIAEILERNGNGSPNFETRKFLDIPTKGELKKHIRECFAGKSEISLFYFSGHGHIDNIGGYIVTPDFQNDDYGVSMHDILEIINNSQCSNRVVILDCCHSGFMGRHSSATQDACVINEGVTILTASKQDEPAVEVAGHGLFTALLIDAMKGGAADVLGKITPGGIYAYIDKSLGAWGQRPVFKTNVTSFSPLRTATPQVDETILRRITQYFPQSNSEFPLNPSFEPTNAPEEPHNIIEPYANVTNTAVFSDLQKLEGVGLVVPCGEEHMYYAAMHSRACRLTPTGQHYWRLVHEGRI